MPSPTKKYPSQWAVFLLGATGSLVLVVALGAYFYHFPGPVETDSQKWALFGDYVGGVLGAFFAFLGLLALLYTIIIQARELFLTRETLQATERIADEQKHTLELQRLENTLFSTIESHDRIRDRTVFLNSHGLDAFSLAVSFIERNTGKPNTLLEIYNDAMDSIKHLTPGSREHGQRVERVHGLQRDIAIAEGLIKKFRPYINTLVFLIDFVTYQEPLSARKQHYMAILRARLSHIEELLLLYCGTPPGGSAASFPFYPVITRDQDAAALKVQVGIKFFHEVDEAFHPQMRDSL